MYIFYYQNNTVQMSSTVHINHKNVIFSRKQFSTQKSVTPKKLKTDSTTIQIQNSQSHISVTSTNNNNNNNKSSKVAGKTNTNTNVGSHASNHRSTSIQNHSVNHHGAGVSYSQLQIILENVQNAKKKAAEHIHTLQNKNKMLQQELAIHKQSIKKYQHVQQTIKKQRTLVQHQYQGQLNYLKQQVIKREDTIVNLNSRINQLQMGIKQKTNELQSSKSSTSNLKQQYSNILTKYENMSEALKISQNCHQFQYIVVNYGNIPNMINQLKNKQQTVQAKNNSIQQLKHVIEQLKEQIHSSNKIISTITQQNNKIISTITQQNNKIISTITQQNNNLLNIISDSAKEKSKLHHNLQEMELQRSTQLKNKQYDIIEYKQKYAFAQQEMQNKLDEKQKVIQDLLTKIEKLKQQITHLQETSREHKQQREFKRVVDEVCNQNEDFEAILQKFKYLQQFRQQYYVSINKVQYLCKMLDQ